MCTTLKLTRKSRGKLGRTHARNKIIMDPMLPFQLIGLAHFFITFPSIIIHKDIKLSLLM